MDKGFSSILFILIYFGKKVRGIKFFISEYGKLK